MLHACGQRFDVTGTVGNFSPTKQGRTLVLSIHCHIILRSGVDLPSIQGYLLNNPYFFKKNQLYIIIYMYVY